MRLRLAILGVLLAFAAGSLYLAGRWGARMNDSSDVRAIDNASYFSHTWMIAFIIFAVGAVATVLNLYTHWKRRDLYDGDGIND